MPRYKILLDTTERAIPVAVQKVKVPSRAFFDACKKIFGDKKFEFYGAGRTDSGVHAIGQVAHLDVKTDMTLQKLVFALNDNLPSDVNVLDAIIAEPNFHARYDATARSYVYVISHVRTAFCKGNVWWVRDNLDQNKMAMAAKLLTGFKDYKSFTDKNAETESTKVDVMWIDVIPSDNVTCIHVVGSHFLWKMVRRLVGVIVEAGRGGSRQTNQAPC